MYTWTDLLLLKSLQNIWKSEHITFSRMLSFVFYSLSDKCIEMILLLNIDIPTVL